MTERIAAALVKLQRLEECIQSASGAGVVFADAFVSEIQSFASHVEEEAERFEALVVGVRREEEQNRGGEDVADAVDTSALGNEENAVLDDDNNKDDGNNHDDGNNQDDDSNEGGAPVEKRRKQLRQKRSRSSEAKKVARQKAGVARLGAKKKKQDPAPAPAPALAAGKKEKLSLFSVAKTSKGAIVLYDPEKVEHRGKKAELVTVPLTKKNNVRILRTELQPCSWGDLTLQQQDALTARMCEEVRVVAEGNLSVITSGEGAGQIMTIFRGGDVALASAGLFQKGSVLQMLAKNAAIRAAYGEYVRLQDIGKADTYRSALETVVESYGVDISVETLIRYRAVGELFHQCPALMLCDFVTTLLDRKELFENMLARPELKLSIDAILLDGEAIENGNGGPVVQLVEGRGDDEAAEVVEDRGNKGSDNAGDDDPKDDHQDDEHDEHDHQDESGRPLKKHFAGDGSHDVCLETRC